jgi:uncharacterized membrane protein
MSAVLRRAQLLIVICLLLAASTAESQSTTASASRQLDKATIEVQDLGTLIPGGWTGAIAINNRGHVVGFAALDPPDDPFSRQVPFLWTPQRGLQPILLDAVPDLFTGVAVGINDGDDVIGRYHTFSGDGLHGFLWNPSEGMVDLGLEFLPIAINNRRQIAGICLGPLVDGEYFQSVACLWEDGVVRPLGLAVGDWGSRETFRGLDINERGEVVGSSLQGFGWLWSPQRGLVELPLESAYAINNSGEIVGHTSDGVVVLSRRGAILRTARGDLQPEAINSRGWVAGWSEATDSPQSAFVWLPDGELKALSSTAFFAGDINDRGQIAGSEWPHEGTLRAIVWTVRASTLRVTTPNSPSRWGVRTPQRLAWTYEGVAPQFLIEISRDSGKTWTDLATVPNRTGNSQTFDWRVTGPLTSGAKFRVTAVGDPGASDVNDVDIRIANATIEILSPTKTTSVAMGKPLTLHFRHSVGARAPVAIDVSSDNGNSWRTVIEATTTGSTTSSFRWIVDLLPTARARLRVRSLDGDGARAVSRAFVVRADSIPDMPLRRR